MQRHGPRSHRVVTRPPLDEGTIAPRLNVSAFRKLALGWGILVLLIVGAIVQDAVQKANTNQRTSAVSALSSSPPGPPSANYGLRQRVATTDWGITVTGTEVLPLLAEGSGQIVPQGKYLLVYLTATNLQNRQRALSFNSFTLYDSAQREYGVATAAPERPLTNPTIRAAENNGLKRITTDLLPSLTVDTVLTFDVVPTASGFQLGIAGTKDRIALGL